MKAELGKLHEPFELGSVKLRNRMVMSPMSRHRATAAGVPTDMMIEYYRQRASAGLIVTEGVYPCATGQGYLFMPGICTERQTEGWHKVTEAVHAEGGRIFVQLMHCGRLSDSLMLPDQRTPVAPSAISPAPDGAYANASPRPARPYGRPRALTTDEVHGVVEDYKVGAVNAFRAGFDGVEIHAGNGYLPAQFLATNTNRRDDEFGGTVEGRTRFLLNLVDALAPLRGPDRVGVRLHPGQDLGDVHDNDPVATTSRLFPALSRRGIGYLHMSLRPVGWDLPGTVRRLFDGTVVAGGGLSRDSAARHLADGVIDLASFGRPFLANPDLVQRYREGRSVTRPVVATYYTQGREGYVDYPTLGATGSVPQVPPDLPLQPFT